MLKSLSAKLGHFLLLYGGWGLFAMSFLDSSLVPFPGVNDLALILMASHGLSGGLFMHWRALWVRCAAPIFSMAQPVVDENSSGAK